MERRAIAGYHAPLFAGTWGMGLLVNGYTQFRPELMLLGAAAIAIGFTISFVLWLTAPPQGRTSKAHIQMSAVGSSGNRNNVSVESEALDQGAAVSDVKISQILRHLPWAKSSVLSYISIAIFASILGASVPIVYVNLVLPYNLARAFSEVKVEGLGRPVGPIQTTGQASQQFFDRANAIWVLRPSMTLYALSEDGKAFVHADNPRVGAKSLFDDQQLRRYTGTPQDKCPPQGGWAVLWHQDPSWKWMGSSRG